MMQLKNIPKNMINFSNDNCLGYIELSCAIKFLAWSQLELCKIQFEKGKN